MGTQLTTYDLDPMPFGTDLPGWLFRHQQMHQDYASVLNLNAPDLVTVDLEDKAQLTSWIYVHGRAHEDAERALKIGG